MSGSRKATPAIDPREYQRDASPSRSNQPAAGDGPTGDLVKEE